MNKEHLATCIVVNTLCLGLAGLELVANQAWFGVILTLIAIICNIVIAVQSNLEQIQ